MGWEIGSDRPVYLQLVEEIQLRIIAGVYALGDKFPSVRDLAQEASVNPNTMQKALQELERQGLVYSQRTSGRFITEDSDLVLRIKDSFASHHVNEFLLKMGKLGFSKEETINKIDNYEKGLN